MSTNVLDRYELILEKCILCVGVCVCVWGGGWCGCTHHVYLCTYTNTHRHTSTHTHKHTHTHINIFTQDYSRTRIHIPHQIYKWFMCVYEYRYTNTHT